ncbi:hypothetical protein TNCV_4722681 [Trichonephila clavipes]|uniref:Uncharacterized protein n=1 Tax=Trichonephila clavipes TaxID=2585209 RepID=A0A8X6W6S2_TRICX|nr:hypothetical protein TNCV_4722681 [Trichonephila clavipes]
MESPSDEELAACVTNKMESVQLCSVLPPQISVTTVVKRRKRSWPPYLMLCKGRYKNMDNFGLRTVSSVIHSWQEDTYVSRKKHRDDAAVLQRASLLSGVTARKGISLKA